MGIYFYTFMLYNTVQAQQIKTKRLQGTINVIMPSTKNGY